MVSLWGCSGGQPPLLLSVHGPAGKGQDCWVDACSLNLQCLKWCVCVWVFSCCRFPALVPLPQQRCFPDPRSYPPGLWLGCVLDFPPDWIRSASASFLLLPPGFSLGLLQQADVAVVTANFNTMECFFLTRWPSGQGQEGSILPAA